MNLLSIGSVIRNKGIELIITGYHLAEEERSFRLYYIVSLFPAGYISGQEKSQGYYPADKDYELVFEGYRDKYCKKYLAQLSERAENLKNMDPELMYAVLVETKKKLEAKKNNE